MGNGKILIVDDNPANIQVLATILDREGYEIENSLEGQGVIPWLESEAFDLVLLDIMMPAVDGFEVCRNIRKREELKDLPVIFLTARDDKETMVKGFGLGAQDFIAKPFDERELLARVQTHIELKLKKEELNLVNRQLAGEVDEKTHEIQEMNKQLVHANSELMKLEEVKAQFLNVIGHEIRTPLNGISGVLQMLKYDNSSPHLSELFFLMDKSVKRLEKFSVTALRITELKSGRSMVDKEVLNIVAIIQESLLQIDDYFDFRDVLVPDYKTNRLMVLGEEDLLHNCFFYLIEGVIKKVEGKVKIKFMVNELSQQVEVLMVASGVLFKESELDKVFGVFEREEGQDDAGLGFSFVKSAIEAHGGTIRVSVSDETLFRIILPRG